MVLLYLPQVLEMLVALLLLVLGFTLMAAAPQAEPHRMLRGVVVVVNLVAAAGPVLVRQPFQPILGFKMEQVVSLPTLIQGKIVCIKAEVVVALRRLVVFQPVLAVAVILYGVAAAVLV